MILGIKIDGLLSLVQKEGGKDILHGSDVVLLDRVLGISMPGLHQEQRLGESSSKAPLRNESACPVVCFSESGAITGADVVQIEDAGDMGSPK